MLTPETLRKSGKEAIAQYKAMDGFPGTGYIGRLGHEMIAAADAWEKDLKERADYVYNLDQFRHENDTLRKRLEEAEKAVLFLVGGDPAEAERFTALAKEET